MKTIAKKVLYGLMLAGSLGIGTTACVITARPDLPVIWVDDHFEHRRHEVYYYPSAEVYFYPSIGFYYWQEGGRWRCERHLPPTISIGIGSRVRFQTDAERPYSVHSRVVERFGGRGVHPPSPHHR